MKISESVIMAKKRKKCLTGSNYRKLYCGCRNEDRVKERKDIAYEEKMDGICMPFMSERGQLGMQRRFRHKYRNRDADSRCGKKW